MTSSIELTLYADGAWTCPIHGGSFANPDKCWCGIELQYERFAQAWDPQRNEQMIQAQQSTGWKHEYPVSPSH